MKKIILFIASIIVGFSVINDTSALSYGGIPNFGMPHIMSTTNDFGNIIASPEFNENIGFPTSSYMLSGSLTGNNFLVSFLLCYQYTASESSGAVLSGNLMQIVIPFNNRNYNINNAFYSNPITVTADYIDSTKTNISLVTSNYLSFGSATTKFSLMDIPTFPNSGGDSPNDGVFCVNPRLWILPKTEADGFNGVYLNSVKYSYYNGSTGNFGYAERSYTQSSVYGYKYIDFDLMGTGFWEQFYSLGYPQTSKVSGNNSGISIFYRNSESITYGNTLSTNGDINYYMLSLTQTGEIQSLPIYFASDSMESGFTTGTGSNGSGSTGGEGFYIDCTSFLDVGCYVEGMGNQISSLFTNIWTSFFDSLTDFFGGIWNWLLPDFTINWNGTTADCAEYQDNSGSGLTISSGSGSIGLLQRFANFISIVSPIPPFDGSTVCLLDGTTKTIDYRTDEINFFDIIIILLCILPILFASHHSTTKPS